MFSSRNCSSVQLCIVYFSVFVVWKVALYYNVVLFIIRTGHVRYYALNLVSRLSRFPSPAVGILTFCGHVPLNIYQSINVSNMSIYVSLSTEARNLMVVVELVDESTAMLWNSDLV